MLDTAAQIAAGIIIGLAFVTAASVLLGLTPRRRPPGQTPPDPLPRGATITTTPLTETRPGSGLPDTDPGKIDVDDVPSGIRMTALNGWDVLAVGVILALALTTPAITAALAPVIVTAVLIDAAFRIWAQSTRTAPHSGREGKPPRPGGYPSGPGSPLV